jgi:hypothetical protein
MHKISGDGTTVETSHADPDYAPNVEVFDHMTYDEIYRGVMKLEPEVLTAGRQTWQNSGSAVGEAVQQAHAEIRAAIADGWRGSAAALASNAVQAFESLGQNVADVMSEVGRRLGQANDAAETLRSSVSHPVSADADLDAALLDPKHAIVNAEMQKTAQNVRLDVVRVMNSVYAGAFIPTGNNVPGFPVGGMYPQQQPRTKPQPGVVSPGTVDTASPATPPASSSNLAATQSDATIHQQDRQQAAQPGRAHPDAAAPVTPAAATAPNTSTTTAGVHPAATAAPAAPANTVAPQADRAAPLASAAAPAVVSAPARSVVTKPQNTSTKPQSTDGDGKRKDKDRSDASAANGDGGADASSGMGAGIVGGLAGGAFAMGDTTRPANTVAAPPRRIVEDEYEDDEDYYPDFDDPTFLEPAEPETELIGQLDPTTPAVVGEWVDDEE